MKEKKNIFYLLRISFFLFLFTNVGYADHVIPQACRQGDCVSLEVVSKQDDMERGLMYRTRLDQDRGMLFVFTFDDKHQFWMKNMQFNLDILWISQDGRIVYIGHDIPACFADPCPVYSPDQTARYVLELKSGFTLAHHWIVGDKLDLKSILEK